MQRRVAMAALVALAGVQCGPGQVPATAPSPTTGRPTAAAAATDTSPATARASVPGLPEDVRAEVAKGRSPLTGLAVTTADGGTDAAFAPGIGPDVPQPVWSVTKSVVSALVGIAVDDGRLRVDDRLVDVLGPVADGHPDVTIEHLLTMTSGIDMPDGDESFATFQAADDWVAAVLDQPSATSPGASFAYCSACVHLLTAALHEVTGDVTAFARDRLFAPLGIDDPAWSLATDGSGIPVGGWGLELTATQMAELGRLYLDGGRREGAQLVPADWVDRSVTPQVKPRPFEPWQVDYGYLWWIHPDDAYAATGRFGQLLLVVPGRSVVVAASADLSDAEAHQSFTYVWDRVVEADAG